MDTQSAVVSYRNSTSNHNRGYCRVLGAFVVSYRNSTSNHNLVHCGSSWEGLYLIEILHQTTTTAWRTFSSKRCILSKFYIKPQHITPDYLSYRGCILSKFYIKPQLIRNAQPKPIVVSYRNSTSNHNRGACVYQCQLVVSYRNSTSNHNTPTDYNAEIRVVSYRNSTSNHNPAPGVDRRGFVVSYRNSTSNHNN